MKKTTLLMLAVCASGPMFAQSAGTFQVTKDSSLTVYGILDAGIAQVSHSLNFDSQFGVAVSPAATKAGNLKATGMYNGGISGSRIGFKGETNLGNGWKALFTLETAVNVPNGNVSNAAAGLAQNKSTGPNMSGDSASSGQLFSRGAFFGVASDTYGSLTLGRNTSFMLDIIPGYDALQGAQLFTPIGFSGSYGGGGATDDSREDSSVKYKIKYNDFNFGFLHKFGGVAGAYNSQSANQVIVGYEKGNFGIQAAYETNTDAFSVANPAGTAAQPLGTIVVTAENTKATMVTARYKLGDLVFKGGLQKQQFNNPSNPAEDSALTSLYGQSVSLVKTTAFTVGGMDAEKDLNVYWLGAAYEVNKSLNVAISYYHIAQNDYSNGTGATNPADLRGTSIFRSLLIDYRFTKAFDVYLGYMANNLSGGMAVGYLVPTNSVTGLGARYSF